MFSRIRPGVMVKSLVLYPEFPSYQSVGCDFKPWSLGRFKPKPLPVESSGVTQNHEPFRLSTAKEQQKKKKKKKGKAEIQLTDKFIITLVAI